MPSIDDSKCVLITGATSGIGRALAFEILKLPTKPTVIGTGRREERLEELSKAGIEALSFELTSEFATLNKALEDTISKHPILDTVVLNAGIQHELDFKKGIDMSSKHVDPLLAKFILIATYRGDRRNDC
ncbi:hypothetical protein CPB83DRAFT_888498 [Crepidotus variabilis]|uniref:Uncharacterized protein n=1 Tax=Crepidotus variabilis TaxID=179855 RepID=A0A9P6JX32_9AGAR|nr:hypothetical protein CPB83DRAFT_888498 [Crepidotus variabilis]